MSLEIQHQGLEFSDLSLPNVSRSSLGESLLRYGIMTPQILTYNTSIRSILYAPESQVKPSTAVYAAAGAGFSDYHSTINAPRALFVSDYSSDSLREDISKAIALINGDESKGNLSRLVETYVDAKKLDGFAGYYRLDRGQLSHAIAYELGACGASNLVLDDRGGVPVLRYSILRDSAEQSHNFEISFLARNFSEMSADDIEDHVGGVVDVYYHRAAMSIPLYYSALSNGSLREIYQRMPIGGYFVTDDIGLDSDIKVAVDCRSEFPYQMAAANENIADIHTHHQLKKNSVLTRQFDNTSFCYVRMLRIRQKQYQDLSLKDTTI